MIIRPAEERDREAICRIHQESARRLACAHYSPAQIESWIGSLTPAAYDFSAPQRDFIVAAEGSGAVIGFGCLDGNAAVIEAVYVAPAAARRGVGTAILHHLEQLAAGRGLAAVQLHATLNAQPFYERSGYASVETTSYRSRGGLELPVIAMRKPLPIHE